MNNRLHEATSHRAEWEEEEEEEERSEERLMNLANELKSAKLKLEEELEGLKAKVTRKHDKLQQLRTSRENLCVVCCNCSQTITALNRFVNRANQLLDQQTPLANTQ